MLLIITNSQDATADYLCGCLRGDDINFIRMDTDTVIENIEISFDSAGPQISFNGNRFHPEDIQNIWFRRPQPLKPEINGDKAELRNTAHEWSEAIEGFLAHIPLERWMNHPAMNTYASHKMEQITRARLSGLTAPKTLITQSQKKLKDFWIGCNRCVIIKPLASGYLERETEAEDSLIYTNQVMQDHLSDLTCLKNCPAFFQEMIHKKCDVRICIVDDEIHAIELHAKEPDGMQWLDIRRDNMNGVSYVPVAIPGEIRTSLFKMVRSYKLRFAAVDMAIDQNDNWIFFEINPNGQWAWLDLAGASNIANSFIRSFSKDYAKGSL